MFLIIFAIYQFEFSVVFPFFKIGKLPRYTNKAFCHNYPGYRLQSSSMDIHKKNYSIVRFFERLEQHYIPYMYTLDK